MSGTISINRFIQICLLLIVYLLGWSSSPAREMLLFAYNAGYEFYCLQLLPTGQLVTTGQAVAVGNDHTFGFAVSPDQRYIWSGYSDSTSQGIHQYQVSPSGQVSTTGRLVSLSSAPDDIMFTPNGQLLIAYGAPIFRVNADSSIQSTNNVYSGGVLNISPRGDINYTKPPSYADSFEIDYINYASAVIITLEIITTIPNYSELQAIYRPAGDYIAFTYFGGYPSGVEVHPVLSNGIVDTTQTWDYGHIGGSYLDITPDGNNIYASGITHLSWSAKSSMFIDVGITTSLSVLQLKVSPDGKFLVVVPGNQTTIKTFAIQTDGSLVDTGYTFDYGSTFGAFIPADCRLIFDWTPLPTGVPYELWNQFDDK